MGNVFQQLIRPVPSVIDRMGQLEALDASALRRRMGEAELGQMQRANAIQDEERAQALAARNALAEVMRQSGGDVGKLIPALEASGSPDLWQRAQAMKKEQLAAQETQGKVAKTAEETLGMRLQRYKDALPSVTTKEQAGQWLLAQYNDPIVGPMAQRMGPFMQVASAIPDDPQGLAKWIERQGLGMAKVAELDIQRGNAARESANATLVQNPAGQWVPNEPLIEAKKAIAKAGASKVEVNTGQKGLDNERDLRNDFRSEQAVKDFNEMQLAHKQIKAGLSAGTPIGDTAAATKIMKLLDPGSVVRESELGMAMAASGRMDRMRNYVEMQLNGTKLTPTQRVEFGKLADELLAASGQTYNAKRQEYIGLADAYKLNTRTIPPAWSPNSAVPPAKPKPGASAPQPAPQQGATVMRFDAQGNPIP